MPGPEEPVMALTPLVAAPYTMLMDATSLSPWMNTPPTSGRRAERYSGISLCGVMG